MFLLLFFVESLWTFGVPTVSFVESLLGIPIVPIIRISLAREILVWILRDPKGPPFLDFRDDPRLLSLRVWAVVGNPDEAEEVIDHLMDCHSAGSKKGMTGSLEIPRDSHLPN